MGGIFTSNMIAVLSIPALSKFMVPPTFINLFEKISSDLTMTLLVKVFPFPIILLAIVSYIWPILRPAFISKDLSSIGTKGMVRLLNAPLILSLLGVLGWVIASIIAQIYIGFMNIDRPLSYDIQVALMSLVLGGITFVVSYYMLEFFNRRYFLPVVFPKARLQDFKGAHEISLRVKLFIFLLTILILPMTVLGSLIYNLNNSGNNIFQMSLMPYVTIFVTIALILGVIVTLMKSNSIITPLIKMNDLAHEINGGNFDVHLPLESNDEIGNLTDSMNEMAVGLREREKLRDVFGKMVDPKVRDHLMKSDLQLGGELREVTILFSDIKNFTSFSENRKPTEIVEILNRYFNTMASCISVHGGVINKFIGDAIMAVFGAPVELENHADSALKAGLAMLEAQQRFLEKASEDDNEVLMSRIGVHTGYVLSGNIGSNERMEYTVIGDAVNTASRLESLCKKLNHDLITSSETLEKASEFSQFKYLGKVKVKGKSNYIKIYTPN